MNKNMEKLIDANLNLVHDLISKIAKNKKYCDYEDLFAQGRLGLILAASEFDSSRGVKFSTFASKFIKREIINFSDSSSHYIDGEVPVVVSNDKDDEKMEILLEKINELPKRDKNILLKYYSDSKDPGNILNSIINQKRVLDIVDKIKLEIGV